MLQNACIVNSGTDHLGISLEIKENSLDKQKIMASGLYTKSTLALGVTFLLTPKAMLTDIYSLLCE